jgi:predicted anti-sigma-YlaC factor YlaD
MDDYGGMDCATAREAISATLDGEDPGVPQEALDAHLAACRTCPAWRDSAAAVTRTARLTPAPTTPDVTDRVMPAFKPTRRPRRRLWLRWALVGAALGQLFVVAVQLLTPVTMAVGGGHPGHLGHETVAFNVAVAVALMWVAARPGRARTQWPLLLSFVGALAVLSVLDLLHGNVGWTRLSSHLPLLVGVLATVLLGRAERNLPGPGERAGQRHRPFTRTGSPQEASRPDLTESDDRYHPPAARRAA